LVYLILGKEIFVQVSTYNVGISDYKKSTPWGEGGNF